MPPSASPASTIPAAQGVYPCVLLTGFDAFGGSDLNPSWLAVQALEGETIAGHRVVAARLPTAFGASLKALAGLLRAHRPQLVICVGQAGGRQAISFERAALNICDAAIADNAGHQPVDVPVVPNGPAAYFSTLPIKAMLHGLEAAGIAAEVSQTAGTFVCNHVFYALMHRLKRQYAKTGTRGGFVHVPFLPEQGAPSMPLQDIVRGLRLAVQIALTTTGDLAKSAGRIS